MSESVANVGDLEITSEMTEAGVKAADLIGFRWGWGDEASLVARVFLAMDAVRRANLLGRERIGETLHNEPRISGKG